MRPIGFNLKGCSAPASLRCPYNPRPSRSPIHFQVKSEAHFTRKLTQPLPGDKRGNGLTCASDSLTSQTASSSAFEIHCVEVLGRGNKDIGERVYHGFNAVVLPSILCSDIVCKSSAKATFQAMLWQSSWIRFSLRLARCFCKLYPATSSFSLAHILLASICNNLIGIHPSSDALCKPEALHLLVMFW